MQNFKFVPSASPKLLNLNQDHPSKKAIFLVKSLQNFIQCLLQCFSSERVLIEHKENCLIINCKQSVRLRSGSIKFKNHFKQLAAPFKIYADFECNVEGVKSNDKK